MAKGQADDGSGAAGLAGTFDRSFDQAPDDVHEGLVMVITVGMERRSSEHRYEPCAPASDLVDPLLVALDRHPSSVRECLGLGYCSFGFASEQVVKAECGGAGQ